MSSRICNSLLLVFSSFLKFENCLRPKCADVSLNKSSITLSQNCFIFLQASCDSYSIACWLKYCITYLAYFAALRI
uniref:Putative secreted protein n=1 Tax=Anopheles darlingi TaxID=43151 RepID=A0A2M4DB20_ANODA